ncbi:hypothetical protein Dimus_026568 [Dionaea muscipula]
MAQTDEESGNQQSCRKEEGDGSVGKKRKHKEVFPYGNYRSYYGYRVGKGMEEDLRFQVLKEEWFKGKDCLDIGCNSGLLTISIAKKFHCKTILGIDIDHERIKDARQNLQKFSRKEKVGNGNKDVARVNDMEALNSVKHAEHLSVNEDRNTIAVGHAADERSLLDIVSFRCENFIESRYHLPVDHYDTIVCLSVTKWVQLNWGDDGLINLFTKIWRLLHPGGILILEPQPWKSYCNNRLVTETTAINFQSIMFYPRDFQEILLDKIGFRMVENATFDARDPRPGFNRPLLVFCK